MSRLEEIQWWTLVFLHEEDPFMSDDGFLDMVAAFYGDIPDYVGELA